MAFLFGKKKGPNGSSKKTRTPEGLWIKCPLCGEIIYRAEVERNFKTCPRCQYHFRLTSAEWFKLLLDEVEEKIGENVLPSDFLQFRDTRPYSERLEKATKEIGVTEAVTCVKGKLNGHRVGMGVFDFNFMGGSMGSVVGERLRLLFTRCAEENIPVITITSSGGARMQEGACSLMQMTKTIAAVKEFRARSSRPFISILSDPTSGGVAASFAAVGDVIIAEPKAFVGFAGPRVIKETIRQELPPGFQRAEFVMEKGFIDMIVPRSRLKDTLSKILSLI